LPTGITVAGFSATGWTCDPVSVTCTRTDVLGKGAFYSSIIITVNVATNAPSNVTNVAIVTGGGDLNPANNTANDPTQITGEAPLITSANSTAFTTGIAGSFTVITQGIPTPSLSESGTLPTGVTFIDNLNGTATISGTPPAGSAGTYPITITAHNGQGADAVQTFTLTVNTVVLQSITVAPDPASIPVGLTQAFTATAHYSDGSTHDVTGTATWTSSDTTLATVNGSGVATGVKQGGPVTIKAAVGAVNGVASLTVTAAVLQSIVVTPNPASVPAGLTQAFTASAHFSDSTTQDVTLTAVWSSTDTTVATVNSSGVATGVKVGGVVINAKFSGVTGGATLSVTAPTLQSITITPNPASLPAGTSLQLTATGHYSDGTAQDVTGSSVWSSTDTTIATVSASGIVAGVKVGGPVTITAKVAAVSGTASLTVTAAVLQTITVTPNPASVPVGLTQLLTATGHYSDGTNQDVTTSASWISSDTTIATVNATGGTTGVKVGGPISITAKIGAITGSTNLTVTAAVVQTIVVSPTPVSVPVGASQPFTATAHLSDGSTQDVTNTAIWSSSDVTIATVSATGVATGVKVGGPVTIKASVGAVSGAASLTVTAATLQSITVTPNPAAVAAGLTQVFAATGHYSDGTSQDVTNTATWSSSDITIATVAGNVVTGVKAGGPVSITAKVGNVTGSASLTVNPPILQSITVMPNPASVPAGLTQPFTASGHYSDGTLQDVTNTAAWSSSDTAIATVSATGVATGVKVGGPVNIFAKIGAVSGSASLTVTAAVLQAITVSPNPASVAAGTNQPFTATGHFSDGSASDVTSSAAWSSSDTTIATVNLVGVATGVKAGGPVMITAKIGAISGSANLTVTAAQLQSITVSPNPASVAAGLTQAFAATGHYSDGTSSDVTGVAAWSSSDITVATVNGTGLATGVKSGGPVSITAKIGAVSGSASLTVTAAVLQSISVTPNPASVPAGLTLPFSASGTYSDGSKSDLTASVGWSSSDPTIATVTNAGVVTGVKAGGPISITAMLGAISGSANLTVTAAQLQSITVSPNPATVTAGLTTPLIATGHYSDGSAADVTPTASWSSSDITIATVNAAGVVTGVKAGGPITISARIGVIIGSSSLTVSPALVQITVNTSPAGLSFTVDGTTYATSQTFTWLVGSSHTLATSSPQPGAAGMQSVFLSWSDAGAIAHGVTAPVSGTSYTATFKTQYQLSTAANPASGGSVTPNSGEFYDAGTVVNLMATPAKGNVFLNWTGPVTNPSNSTATITMSAPQSVTANFDAIPTVVDYRVLFGTQSYSLLGSTRNRLPWQVTGIQVVFSKPITNGSAASLAGLAVSGFSGLGTSTLTWEIAPVSQGSAATTLLGTGPNALKDAAGTPIASFAQNLRVLDGDVNDDGYVSSSDVVAVNNARALPYNALADLNGDGVVDLTDVNIVRSRIGASLP